MSVINAMTLKKNNNTIFIIARYDGIAGSSWTTN